MHQFENASNVKCDYANWTLMEYGEKDKNNWYEWSKHNETNELLAEATYFDGTELNNVAEGDISTRLGIIISEPSFVHSKSSCIHTVQITIDRAIYKTKPNFFYSLACYVNLLVDGEEKTVTATHHFAGWAKKSISLIHTTDIPPSREARNSRQAVLDRPHQTEQVNVGVIITLLCQLDDVRVTVQHTTTLLQGLNKYHSCVANKNCVVTKAVSREDHAVHWQCKKEFNDENRDGDGFRVSFSDTLVTMVILPASKIVMKFVSPNKKASSSVLVMGSLVEMECQIKDAWPAYSIHWGIRYNRNEKSSNIIDVQLSDSCKNMTDEVSSTCNIREDILDNHKTGFTTTSILQVKALFSESKEIGFVCWSTHSNGTKLEDSTWLSLKPGGLAVDQFGNPIDPPIKCQRDDYKKKMVTNGKVYKMADSSNFVFHCRLYLAYNKNEVNVTWLFKPLAENTTWKVIGQEADLRIVDMNEENIGSYRCEVKFNRAEFIVTGYEELELITEYHVDIACDVMGREKKMQKVILGGLTSACSGGLQAGVMLILQVVGFHLMHL